MHYRLYMNIINIFRSGHLYNEYNRDHPNSSSEVLIVNKTMNNNTICYCII